MFYKTNTFNKVLSLAGSFHKTNSSRQLVFQNEPLGSGLPSARGLTKRTSLPRGPILTRSFTKRTLRIRLSQNDLHAVGEFRSSAVLQNELASVRIDLCRSVTAFYKTNSGGAGARLSVIAHNTNKSPRAAIPKLPAPRFVPVQKKVAFSALLYQGR